MEFSTGSETNISAATTHTGLSITVAFTMYLRPTDDLVLLTHVGTYRM